MVGLGARTVPALLVRDMEETLGFYRRLGFELTGFHPSRDEPEWAQVSRDGIVFQFHTEPSIGTPAEPVLSGTLYLYPDDVVALARQWQGVVEFAWGVEEMPYGMREFAVRDPNGYYIAFTEPTER